MAWMYIRESVVEKAHIMSDLKRAYLNIQMGGKIHLPTPACKTGLLDDGPIDEAFTERNKFRVGAEQNAKR